MTKIALFIKSLNGGGAERVVLNLANEFYERKIPLILILRFKKGVYLKELNPDIKIVELGTNNPFLMINRIIKACKDNKITTLFPVMHSSNIIGLIANVFLRIRIVIRESNTFDDFFNKKGLKKIKMTILLCLMKLWYPQSEKIIANTKDTANDILKHINVPKEKVVVINNPLVNERITKLSKEPINDLKYSKITKPRIISVGRLVYQKNYEFLIKCFKQVKKTLPEASLIILGTGPLKNQLITLVKELDLDNEVHFLGFVNNPYKYLKNSDVFVLSSFFEGFGNVLVEALAVGLPIVSTDCPGGPREILDNGNYGTLVPLNNVDAMTNAIIQTIRKKNDTKSLVERANSYSINKIADVYLKVM